MGWAWGSACGWGDDGTCAGELGDQGQDWPLPLDSRKLGARALTTVLAEVSLCLLPLQEARLLISPGNLSTGLLLWRSCLCLFPVILMGRGGAGLLSLTLRAKEEQEQVQCQAKERKPRLSGLCKG